VLRLDQQSLYMTLEAASCESEKSASWGVIADEQLGRVDEKADVAR
jgi:hypothetical protein